MLLFFRKNTLMCCSIFYHLLGYKTIDILLSWQMVDFAMFTREGFAMGGWKYFEE